MRRHVIKMLWERIYNCTYVYSTWSNIQKNVHQNVDGRDDGISVIFISFALFCNICIILQWTLKPI